MTAEIGSLAVSLSMDASNFNGTISQVDRNLRAMGGELQAVRAQGADYGKSVEGLSQKQDILQRSLTASSVKLQEQRRKYDEMVASGNASEAALERQAAAVNRAQTQYNRFQTELDQVSRELSELQDMSRHASQAIDEIGNKATAVGSKMKDMGGAMTTSVTSPLLALGAGAITVATQFDTAQAKIQGQLGVTAQEAEKLTQVARDVWKKGFGEDIGQVTTDLSILKQYIKDVGDQELTKLLESGYTLQELFGTDMQESARTASVMMKVFGIEGQEAMDLITVAFQRGGDFSGELLDTLREYAPQFKALGYDAEGFTSILIAGAEAGAFNLDKIGDSAKESFLRIGDGSKSSRDALKDLGLDFNKIESDINSGGESANSAFAAVASAISLVKEPAEKSALAIALMGTPIEDLGPEFQDFFANVSTELGDFEGAAQKAGETLQQSFGERLQSTWRTTQESLLPLGETLLDIAEEHLPKIIDAVESAATWFGDLSPKAQGATLAIGGIVAVAGPAVAVLGMFVSGIGGIVTASAPVIASLAGATSGVGLLGSALAVATGPVGLTVAAVAALGIGVYALSQDLGESSIQVEDWSNKVSEGTAKAVGGFLELSDQASGHLSTLSLTGQAVTQEMATNITTIFSQMGQQVLAEMQSDHEEQLAAVTNFYANSNVLIESEEAEILARTAEYQANKEIQISEGNARIAEIMAAASNEKRELTLAEEAEISRIHATMKDNAIKYLTESELEQQVIYESIKNNASEMSALQAAEVVKNSVKQKDEVVAEAEEQYKKAVAEIIKQRDEMGVISAEQSKQLIEDAGKQRDETIKAAEEQHEKIVTEAKAQAEEHVNQVDWETGEIKSKWEVMKQDTLKKMKEIGSSIKKDWSQAWTDTKKYVGDIKKAAEDKMEEMRSGIVNKMTEVKTKIETKWKEAQSFLEGINLIDTGKEIVNGLIKGINDKFGSVKKKVEELANKLPQWARDVLGIASPSKVFRQIGLWTGEGLAIGIDGSSTKVNTAMENITDGILSVSEKFQKEHSNLIDDFNSKNENKADKTLEKIEKIRSAAAQKKRSLTEKELKEIAILEASYRDDKLKSDRDFEKKYLALVQQSEKEYLEVVKTYIAEKKSLDQLSLLDEVEIWERSVEIFNEGSKERLVAQKEYKTAVEAVNKELTATNKEYSDQIVKVNEDLVKSEEALNKAYEDAVVKRASSLVNFKGVFDEFKFEIGATGDELMSNLQSQVSAFEEWQRQIDMLSDKAINEGLLAELKEMGPNALPQLIALNGMTDKQLTEYSDLYSKKSKLAREQAEKELVGMKNDTEKQIKAMQLTARTQLSVLNSDWAEKIRSLTKTTDDELSSLERIGRDAGQGLLNGLSSQEGPLQNKAREIADSIKRTIQTALDIHSPSRVMRGFGVNIGQGLALGMDDSVSKVAGAAQRMASSVEDGGNFARITTSSINKSRTYHGGETHIHVYGEKPSASEIARKALQVERQRAMEWGMA